MTSLASEVRAWSEPVPATGPPPALLEPVSCYMCGSSEREHFITAEDDLGGTAGTFKFVPCSRCRQLYQNPRVA